MRRKKTYHKQVKKVDSGSVYEFTCPECGENSVQIVGLNQTVNCWSCGYDEKRDGRY